MTGSKDNYSTMQVDYSKSIYKITFNRPEKLNAFNEQMFNEFLTALDNINQDSSAKAVIITGNGRAFCSGGDVGGFFIKMIEDRQAGKKPFDIPGWMTTAGLLMRNISIPIIAAINGAAIGFGFTLCLQCDIRIASENAVLGLPFVKLGIIPEYGCTYTLPRLVGMGKACELIFTGKTIKAREAMDIGLVNSVVPADQLLTAAQTLAGDISEGAVIALKKSKQALYSGIENEFGRQIKLEEQALGETLITEDHEEAIRAFLAKRRPEFKAR